MLQKTSSGLILEEFSLTPVYTSSVNIKEESYYTNFNNGIVEVEIYAEPGIYENKKIYNVYRGGINVKIT